MAYLKRLVFKPAQTCYFSPSNTLFNTNRTPDVIESCCADLITLFVMHLSHPWDVRIKKNSFGNRFISAHVRLHGLFGWPLEKQPSELQASASPADTDRLHIEQFDCLPLFLSFWGLEKPVYSFFSCYISLSLLWPCFLKLYISNTAFFPLEWRFVGGFFFSRQFPRQCHRRQLWE